jgi:hypothetical protein
VRPNSTRINPPFKADPPPVYPPDTLPLVSPDDAPGPIAAFAALVRCTEERDYGGATAARKALRRFGWSCAPCSRGGA